MVFVVKIVLVVAEIVVLEVVFLVTVVVLAYVDLVEAAHLVTVFPFEVVVHVQLSVDLVEVEVFVVDDAEVVLLLFVLCCQSFL